MDFKLKKYWYVFVLLFIFLFSYYIRAINIVPDRLLSFDPILQYRFTKYLVDWGHLPVWDELSYYTGRNNTPTDSTFFWYVTAALYLLFKSLGPSLLTLASYASAIYGAMIILPAFLLGRELSNKYGGLAAAILIGTAPQILTRTFGSSYDTDQFVVFFILLTLYLGIYAMKRKSIASVSLAILGFTAFMLTWNDFGFTFFILIGYVIIHFILYMFFGDKNKKVEIRFYKNIRPAFSEVKYQALVLLFIFLGILLIGYALEKDPLASFSAFLNFAQNENQWIVNVSIAELQSFSIFSLEGWITAMGRFMTGNGMIDVILFIIFIISLLFGIFISQKRDLKNLSLIITLFLISLYITFKGIRFTEYSSALLIIPISVGFGYLIEYSKKNQLFKASSIALVICIAIIAMSIGQQIGQSLGPDISANWDSAWNFLKTQTPEFSLVGTWWDPGHMITGLGERRVIADGAHCADNCMYNINDRIVDLGLIMATTDENVSMNLIRKYQGDSPNVYWIASDDLIGKYQWLQYFGINCDARTDQSCPLYMQIPINSQGSLVDNNGNVIFRSYPLGNTTQILIYNSQVPIPIYIQGINAVLFDEFIVYNGTQPITVKFNETEKNDLITSLKPLEQQLNIRFSNQSIPMTVWIPNFYDYIVVIPPNLRNTVFTRMFMLSGQGLNCFKLVFNNDQVRIFEVNTECKA